MIEILKISLIAYMIFALGQPDDEGKYKNMFGWHQRLISHLPWYLSKPLGSCFLCFTGEIMLWYYIFTKEIYFTAISIIDFGFFVSAGIFCALIYHTIWTIGVYLIKKYD